MATMRKCAWFACLFSVVCISGIVAPIPKVDATFPLPPIIFPPFPFPFPPFPRSPPPPPPQSPPPPPPLIQTPPLPPVNLRTLINVNGTLFCTINGTTGANGSATPVFSNATVQLRCGGNTLSTTTTNQNGTFTFTVIPDALPVMINNCSLVGVTPLSNCNATLPNTTFVFPLGLPTTSTQVFNLIRFLFPPLP